MAVLSTSDREAVSAALQRDASSERQLIPLTKAQLQAAINAVDEWVEANAASYNSALPVAARTGLTARQKVELLFRVMRKRFEAS